MTAEQIMRRCSEILRFARHAGYDLLFWAVHDEDLRTLGELGTEIEQILGLTVESTPDATHLIARASHLGMVSISMGAPS